MDKITLVTAFFDIGRIKFKAIPRSNNIYIDNFKFWARLNNELIVYTESGFKDSILQIRREFGLESKTKVIIIDDIYRIEPEILSRMKQIHDNGWFTRFRILPNATSNIPNYSYVMLLKNWFMKDIVEKRHAKGQIAWMDFGFNHGGDLYTHAEDFDFEWKYDFGNKIHLFYYKELDQKPIYETVRRLSDSIMGCLYIVPSNLCEHFWDLTKASMLKLLDVGLYDDDQLLLLMSYRVDPQIYTLHKSDWFLPIKEFGGSHLRTRNKISRPKYKQIIIDTLQSYKKLKLALRASIITFHDLTCR